MKKGVDLATWRKRKSWKERDAGTRDLAMRQCCQGEWARIG